MHPDTRVTETVGGVDYDIYVKDFTDERYILQIGDEMQWRIIPRRLDLVVAGFFWKALALEGFEPYVEQCVECGATEPLVAFDMNSGGVLCDDDRRGRDPFRARADLRHRPGRRTRHPRGRERLVPRRLRHGAQPAGRVGAAAGVDRDNSNVRNSAYEP